MSLLLLLGSTSLDGMLLSRTLRALRRQASSSTTTALDAVDANNVPNHRFWTYEHRAATANDSVVIPPEVDLSRVQMGIALSKKFNVLVPIIDGQMQHQHTAPLPQELVASATDDYLLLCAFSPRAGTGGGTVEEERPVDVARQEALDTVLRRMGISTEELLSAKLAGTSPARVYRSFVCPKEGKTHILEPVERAANRTALQLDLALRQLRADENAYLRNTDRASLHVSRTVNPIVLILDNVRSAFNTGSLFRTGETAGVAEIVTCGITPTPPHPKLRKTALSSVEAVPCRHFDDTLAAVADLKARGYKVVVMETTAKSQVYTDVAYTDKVALVLGNEVMGVDTRVMEAADLIVEIPTFGVKNSLNVASAAPIVLFEVLRQYAKRDKSPGAEATTSTPKPAADAIH